MKHYAGTLRVAPRPILDPRSTTPGAARPGDLHDPRSVKG